jgi:hypothetical protein
MFNCYRILPAFRRNDRTMIQVSRDLLDRECRRHDDNAQVRPDGLLDEAHKAECKIAVEAALVKFVKDYDTVFFEERVAAKETRNQTWRDGEDAGKWTTLAIEANAIADLVAELAAALLCHASCGGACGQAARFEQENSFVPGKTSVEKRRRHARRLAGAGRGAKDGIRLALERSN